MIKDPAGRYLLFRSERGGVVRYDRRWRRSRRFLECIDDLVIHEGASGFFLSVRTGSLGLIECSVHSVLEPDRPIASGRFVEKDWTFEANAEAWANVPEYLLVAAGPKDPETGKPIRHHLLRLADKAEPDPLEPLGDITSVIPVPDSRLVVLAGGGMVTVWDPIGHRAGAHIQLTAAGSRTTMRFRSAGAELWVNDADSILKFETKHWDAIDGAGSEDAGGRILNWCFDADDRRCLVVREGRSEVIVIDCETMMPVSAANFAWPVADATFSGGSVLAVGFDDQAKSRKLEAIPT